MKYFLYTKDMISTCFYSNSGYNSLIAGDSNALNDWVEITEDLYEQGMTIDESGQRALYAYNESGDKITSCSAISFDEAQTIMKEAEAKRVAEMEAERADKEAAAPSTDEAATIIDASYTESSAAASE